MRLAHPAQLTAPQTADLPHQRVLLLAQLTKVRLLLARIERATALLEVGTMSNRQRGVDQPDHEVDLSFG